MLERYSLCASAGQLADYFGVDPHGFEKPKYNASPSQLLPVITTNSKGLSHFYWGVSPKWAKNKSISEKIINVWVEHITERPTIRKSLKKYRCIIPADGFYGWKKIGKKTLVPYRIQMHSRALFSMAGIWEEFDDENGDIVHTFSIITCPSNPLVNPISERMPVILNKAGEKKWLDEKTGEEELLDLLKPVATETLEAFTISPRINTIEADDATLIMPAPAADQHGNLTLFD